MIWLFIVGQPHCHLQEISGCLPIGVAEKKRADRLDGFGNSAIEMDKTEITDVVSNAQILEHEIVEILKMGFLNSTSIHVHHELDLKIVDQTRQNVCCVTVPGFESVDQLSNIEILLVLNHPAQIRFHRRQKFFSFELTPQEAKNRGLEKNKGVVQ